MNPVILDSATQARDLSLKNNMKDAEVKVLDKLRCTSRAIERMEEKVAFLVKEADKLRHQKRNAEYQLRLKDRVVLRTSEREKQDDEAEREKQKREEDENVESTSKNQKCNQ